MSVGLRRTGLFAGLLALLLLCSALSLSVGSNSSITPEIAWQLLWHPDGSFESEVITGQRVPRTLLLILVGAALGVAGMLIQSLTRNPIADPGILGLNAGASLVVVLAVAITGVVSVWFYVWFAFVGAAIVGVIVYILGGIGSGGSGSPARLALAGIAVNMAITAIVQTVILTNQNTYNEFRFWAAGSAEGRGWPVLFAVVGFIALGLIGAAMLTPALNALALGADTAAGLGVPVNQVRGLVLACITVLAGAATAAFGPISFIGLVVPYIARAFGGGDQRITLPFAILVGPIVMLIADVLGRVLAFEGEVQVGIVAALIGGPFFVAVVRRRRIEAL